jgi:hypothetical protein
MLWLNAGAHITRVSPPVPMPSVLHICLFTVSNHDTPTHVPTLPLPPPRPHHHQIHWYPLVVLPYSHAQCPPPNTRNTPPPHTHHTHLFALHQSLQSCSHRCLFSVSNRDAPLPTPYPFTTTAPPSESHLFALHQCLQSCSHGCLVTVSNCDEAPYPLTTTTPYQHTHCTSRVSTQHDPPPPTCLPSINASRAAATGAWRVPLSRFLTPRVTLLMP